MVEQSGNSEALTMADRGLVQKLIECLSEVIKLPFRTDDRVAGYLMPTDAQLKPQVFVQRWNQVGDGVFSAVVEKGKRPPKPDEPYHWVPPALVLGIVWINWPQEPNDAGLAYKVAEWLLVLESRQKAEYDIKLGPVVAGIPSVQFSTGHNGFGACQMGLIYDPT